MPKRPKWTVVNLAKREPGSDLGHVEPWNQIQKTAEESLALDAGRRQQQSVLGWLFNLATNIFSQNRHENRVAGGQYRHEPQSEVGESEGKGSRWL